MVRLRERNVGDAIFYTSTLLYISCEEDEEGPHSYDITIIRDVWILWTETETLNLHNNKEEHLLPIREHPSRRVVVNISAGTDRQWITGLAAEGQANIPSHLKYAPSSWAWFFCSVNMPTITIIIATYLSTNYSSFLWPAPPRGSALEWPESWFYLRPCKSEDDLIKPVLVYNKWECSCIICFDFSSSSTSPTRELAVREETKNRNSFVLLP